MHPNTVESLLYCLHLWGISRRPTKSSDNAFVSLQKMKSYAQKSKWTHPIGLYLSARRDHPQIFRAINGAAFRMSVPRKDTTGTARRSFSGVCQPSFPQWPVQSSSQASGMEGNSLRFNYNTKQTINTCLLIIVLFQAASWGTSGQFLCLRIIKFFLISTNLFVFMFTHNRRSLASLNVWRTT